jgi:hypothetical protein
VTPDQIAALSFLWKFALAAFGVGCAFAGIGYTVYRAVKAAGNPIKMAAQAAATETLVQTGILRELKTAQESTAGAVVELGRRFTTSDERNERQQSETTKELARHDAILATHADAIHAQGLKFKPIEDQLARVETVIGLRKTDLKASEALVAALAPAPPSAETPASSAPAEEVS